MEACRSEIDFEVIVVDNGSIDGSADMIAKDFSWVKLIRSPENLGFTGGHNLALKERSGSDAFLLNSDAFITAGALSGLHKIAQERADVGIIGPKLLNPDGSLQMSCRRFPNPVAALFRSTLLGKFFPNNRFAREYLMTDWDHSSSKEVDWISGAAFYVKSTTIEKIGVFDESFFMYCEDVDWCFRAHKAGLKVLYFPEVEVTHKIGSSSSKAVNKMIIRFHRSMFRFYRKNMIDSYPAIMRPLILIGAFLALSLRAILFMVKNVVLTVAKIGKKVLPGEVVGRS